MTRKQLTLLQVFAAFDCTGEKCEGGNGRARRGGVGKMQRTMMLIRDEKSLLHDTLMSRIVHSYMHAHTHAVNAKTYLNIKKESKVIKCIFILSNLLS